MEKTYKRVPFDIELTKKIQSREVEGRLISSKGYPVRIICFDYRNLKKDYHILFTIEYSTHEGIFACDDEGRVDMNNFRLYIELPEEAPKHEFKPFDEVLVRDNNEDKWVPDIFRYYDAYAIQDYPYRCCANDYKQCIPYEGNEHLVGTTNNP